MRIGMFDVQSPRQGTVIGNRNWRFHPTRLSSVKPPSHPRVSMKCLRALALTALSGVFIPQARANLNADSPVKFPKEGALPPKYVPDRPAKDGREIEPGTYLSSTPER